MLENVSLNYQLSPTLSSSQGTRCIFPPEFRLGLTLHREPTLGWKIASIPSTVTMYNCFALRILPDFEQIL